MVIAYGPYVLVTEICEKVGFQRLEFGSNKCLHFTAHHVLVSLIICL
jgi:hypothetical protein